MPGEFVLTMPGAYHSGFSTGINIGEAVNFASSSWLKYGMKAQNIYRRTREKIPVFPFEWLTIQNIINLKTTNLSQTTKQELFKTYKFWYDFEIKQRTEMEAKLTAMANSIPIEGF